MAEARCWTLKYQLKLLLWCLIVVIHEFSFARLPLDSECNRRKGKYRPKLSKMTGKALEKYINIYLRAAMWTWDFSSINTCNCIQKQLLVCKWEKSWRSTFPSTLFLLGQPVISSDRWFCKAVYLVQCAQFSLWEINMFNAQFCDVSVWYSQ